MKNIILTISFSLFIFSSLVAQNHANQIELEVHQEEGVNELKWQSNREVNSSHYLIEASEDGVNYKIIDQIKAGSSTYQKTYYNYELPYDSIKYQKVKVSLVLMDGKRIEFIETIDQQRPNYTDKID